MSGWVSPHPPCIKSDPTWGAEGWRWGGEVGGENGRPPLHRVGGALVEASISGHSRKDWERIWNCTIPVSLRVTCEFLSVISLWSPVARCYQYRANLASSVMRGSEI